MVLDLRLKIFGCRETADFFVDTAKMSIFAKDNTEK